MSAGRSDLAHLIGTTPESLSLTLHRLKARGLVDLDREGILLKDPAGLRGLVTKPQ